MNLRCRRVAIALFSALALIVAACGSQLDPATVRAANGGMPAAPGAGPVTGPDAATGSAEAGATGTGTSGRGGDKATDGGSTGDAPDSADPVRGQRKASCGGFKNGTGITDDQIVIANASDISGPIPGLFESSQEATKAFAAYFNASSDICGRKLKVLAMDSRTDAGADQQAYVNACEKAFAAVGSMSGFDSGGAATAEGCGLPDIRSVIVTKARFSCGTCYGAQGYSPHEFHNTIPSYFKKKNRPATQKAAYLWINAGAAAENAKVQMKAMSKQGMKFVYASGIDVSEFNYAPYVQQMKEKGVRMVQFIGAYQQASRLAKAMQQQSFKPEAYVLDPTAYDPRFVSDGGSAVEGTYVYVSFVPFEEMRSSKELQLYNQWLQQVKPGATPTFFGLFSWSATRLFVEQSVALGGKLSRKTLLDRVRGVDDWTGNGMHAPQAVGGKHLGDCWRWLRIKGGKFVPEGGTKYACSGVTKVG